MILCEDLFLIWPLYEHDIIFYICMYYFSTVVLSNVNLI